MANLGNALRIFREASNMTQKQFSELAQISAQRIGAIELGKVSPNLNEIGNICEALSISPDVLLVCAMQNPAIPESADEKTKRLLAALQSLQDAEKKLAEFFS